MKAKVPKSTTAKFEAWLRNTPTIPTNEKISIALTVTMSRDSWALFSHTCLRNNVSPDVAATAIIDHFNLLELATGNLYIDRDGDLINPDDERRADAKKEQAA